LPAETAPAITAVARLLAGVDALGTEWSEADQIRYVRTFLEQGIDALARAEDARFDFLADCAMLAADNMQDARLHVTDERLAKLEDPEGDATIGGFFVELAFILALELVVVATVTYAVPALIAFVAAGARAQMVRRLTHVAPPSLSALKTAVTDAEEALVVARRDYPWFDVTPEAAKALGHAAQALGQAEREYALGLAAHATSEELAKKVGANMENVAGGLPILNSEKLRHLLHEPVASTAVGRLGEQVATDDLVRKLLAATPVVASEAPKLFQTSSLVGRFLEANERGRAEAARQWGETRFHIRVLPDASLVTSEIANQLLWQLTADPPPPGSPGPGPGARDADLIVRGMEVVLWLAWLRQIQALGQRAVTNVLLPVFGNPHEGGVWEDMFITSQRRSTDPRATVTSNDGIQYPGLLGLADGHGRYLYGQFAREFFIRSPESCPSGLKFDAARYDTVDALPDGQERTDRIAEMKLLTIVFFQTLEADPTAIGSSADPLVDEARDALRDLLGLEEGQDTFAAFLASQPETSEPDGALPHESPLLDPAQEALAAFAADRVPRDDAAKLATMVTDLDLLISQAPAESLDATADLVARFEAEDLRLAIQDQQTAVWAQYQTFLKHAAGQTALVDEVNAEYEARIRLLVHWPPPDWQLSDTTPTP